ncbi:hypothetical protein A10D4_07056 [Idiomarina xiamenensis 10-D-4]|uniref:Capsule assembly Wzi family protein n=2 Tax=Idiomarina xiamenensis TaxID=1207041 RepID=K2L210_9GAMM|nr:hypothetical protein A10D4_07056 [Idiomarina xiamenensis 10-D-4]
MRLSSILLMTCCLLSTPLLLLSKPAQASPWIEVDNGYLRQSLLTLANAGIIRAPVNTYPLPWRSIMADLDRVNVAQLSDDLRFAYRHVNHYLNLARGDSQTVLQLAAHSNDDSQTLLGFGDQYHEKARLTIKREIVTHQFAARLQVNRRNHPQEDDNNTTVDGSYVAGMLGQWVVSLDTLPLWWGPGQDSALLMSSNARPLPKIQLSQFRDKPIDFPVLSWLGPLNFTAFVGRMENAYPIDDSYLWGARLSFRPHPAVEIGLNQTEQFGGDKLTRMPGNNELVRESIDSNRLASADIRISLPAWHGNTAIYGEVATDNSDSLSSGNAWLAGTEWQLGSRDYHLTWFFEISDSQAKCVDSQSQAGNCFYEHEDYEQGYRRFGRAIGSTYDTDSKAHVMGLRWYDASGAGWSLKLRKINFNRDDSQPLLGGHPYYDRATERKQIDLSRRQPLFGGLLNISVQAYQEQDARQQYDTEYSAYAQWEWRF